MSDIEQKNTVLEMMQASAALIDIYNLDPVALLRLRLRLRGKKSDDDLDEDEQDKIIEEHNKKVIELRNKSSNQLP